MTTSFLTHYKKKRVLVTGHTGFKGSWLCAWLKQLGAEVIGVALPPPDNNLPNLFEAAHISDDMTSLYQDIHHLSALQQIFETHQPEIIFHLAAQALVRPSYRDPVNTYMTNVVGTANVLEAARHCPSVKAIVAVTTDKCYHNNEWVWGYRETDTLGGKDPYSASKACAELVIASYRDSLFPLLDFPIHLASARGGNVIGGGDWSEDRLIPDIINALQNKKTITLRNPTATRPWQHVLELLRGYLMLGAKLNTPDGAQYASAWNFGPASEDAIPVESLVKQLATLWGTSVNIQITPEPLHEAHFLYLDASKAKTLLNWHPTLNIQASLALTADWYKAYHQDCLSAGRWVNQQILTYSQHQN